MIKDIQEIDKKCRKNEYANAALGVAELVTDEKQKAYGDSFGKSREVIRILYPDGISREQYADALAVIRVIDKLFRIATDRDALGESPWQDIAGYALLATVQGGGDR